MKILRRIRQIASSPKLRNQNTTTGTNNLPPILFSSIHGENIRISSDGVTAKRAESFCKGIAFSNRPIRVNEVVCIKLADISSSWSGALRFGFTSNDPSTFRSGLPKYACPDLTNKPGNWAKALGERLAQRGSLLTYYVNHEGNVYYSIDGEEKGIFLGGVNVNGPLWALLDVYGNTIGIEFVDRRQQINRPRSVEIDRIIPQLTNLSMDRESRDPLPQVYRNANFQKLSFHATKGCNIRLSNDRCAAERNNNHYCQGYVFSERPLHINEKMVLQILQNDGVFAGSLAFGLSTCNPSNLNGNDLPEDPHQLLDRPEYWVVIKDVANSPQAGDELAFKITEYGEVQLIKNRQPPVTLMHVDSTQKFWAFFDLYGSTIKIKSLGSINESNESQNLSLSFPVMQVPSITRVSPGSNSSLSPTDSLTVRLPKNEKKSNNIFSVNNSNQANSGSLLTSNECTVCCEKPIDSVLYMCGHMCMCYECAIKQWRGHNGGQCPICRAMIRDVIRTYWS